MAKRGGLQSLIDRPPLTGIPRRVRIGPDLVPVGPDPRVRRVAAEYMQRAGMPYDPPTAHAPVPPARGRMVARDFDAMRHDPNDPLTRAAYAAMMKETGAQYEAARRAGFKPRFWWPDKEADPYAVSPRQATEDVRRNHAMAVFPTLAGYGSDNPMDVSSHPMLEDTGERWGGKPVLYNDLFRAVHDYFGHAKEGIGFRAPGEENAYRQHTSMYSPLAHMGVASETRGQNSWLNYGPFGASNFNARTLPEPPLQGDERQRTVKAGGYGGGDPGTVYADQKVGVLPLRSILSGTEDYAGQDRVRQMQDIMRSYGRGTALKARGGPVSGFDVFDRAYRRFAEGGEAAPSQQPERAPWEAIQRAMQRLAPAAQRAAPAVQRAAPSQPAGGQDARAGQWFGRGIDMGAFGPMTDTRMAAGGRMGPAEEATRRWRGASPEDLLRGLGLHSAVPEHQHFLDQTTQADREQREYLMVGTPGLTLPGTRHIERGGQENAPPNYAQTNILTGAPGQKPARDIVSVHNHPSDQPLVIPSYGAKADQSAGHHVLKDWADLGFWRRTRPQFHTMLITDPTGKALTAIPPSPKGKTAATDAFSDFRVGTKGAPLYGADHVYRDVYGTPLVNPDHLSVVMANLLRARMARTGAPTYASNYGAAAPTHQDDINSTYLGGPARTMTWDRAQKLAPDWAREHDELHDAAVTLGYLPALAKGGSTPAGDRTTLATKGDTTVHVGQRPQGGAAEIHPVAGGLAKAAAALIDRHRRESGIPLAQSDTGPLHVTLPPQISARHNIDREIGQMADRAAGAAPARHFYEESGRHAGEVAGSLSAARQYIGALAYTSPNDSIRSNQVQAVKAWNQAARRDPINAGRFPVQMGKGLDATLYRGEFPDPRKIGSFGINMMEPLDPSAGERVTNDIQHMRASGFQGPGGRLWDGTPTVGEDNYVRATLGRAPGVLNERGDDGGGWDPKQVQAALWARQRAKHENPLTPDEYRSYGTLAPGLTGRFTWNSAPRDQGSDFYRGTPEERAHYHHLVEAALTDDQGRDAVAHGFGMLTPRNQHIQAHTQWLDGLIPGSQSGAMVGRTLEGLPEGDQNLLDAVAGVRGALLRQPEAGWSQTTRGVVNPAVPNRTQADVRIGRPYAPEELALLHHDVQRRLGRPVPYPLPHPQGASFLNDTARTGIPNPDFHKAVQAAASSSADLPAAGHSASHALFGRQQNDWARNPEGQGYLDAIHPALRQRAHGLVSVLGPRVAAAEDEAHKALGWKPDARSRFWGRKDWRAQRPGIDAARVDPTRPWESAGPGSPLGYRRGGLIRLAGGGDGGGSEGPGAAEGGGGTTGNPGQSTEGNPAPGDYGSMTPLGPMVVEVYDQPAAVPGTKINPDPGWAARNIGWAGPALTVLGAVPGLGMPAMGAKAALGIASMVGQYGALSPEEKAQYSREAQALGDPNSDLSQGFAGLAGSTGGGSGDGPQIDPMVNYTRTRTPAASALSGGDFGSVVDQVGFPGWSAGGNFAEGGSVANPQSGGLNALGTNPDPLGTFVTAMGGTQQQQPAQQASVYPYAEGGDVSGGGGGLQVLADHLTRQGRNGDTMLAHINPDEARLLKLLGGSGSINPSTGLPEYFFDEIGSFLGNLLGGGSEAADAAQGLAEAVPVASEAAQGADSLQNFYDTYSGVQDVGNGVAGAGDALPGFFHDFDGVQDVGNGAADAAPGVLEAAGSYADPTFGAGQGSAPFMGVTSAGDPVPTATATAAPAGAVGGDAAMGPPAPSAPDGGGGKLTQLAASTGGDGGSERGFVDRMDDWLFKAGDKGLSRAERYLPAALGGLNALAPLLTGHRNYPAQETEEQAVSAAQNRVAAQRVLDEYRNSLPQNQPVGVPSRNRSMNTSAYNSATDWAHAGEHPMAAYFDNNTIPSNISQVAGGGQVPRPQPQGGLPGPPTHVSGQTPRYVRGPGGGRDDQIPALLDDHEYVMDSELVSLLGDGDPDLGARRLDEFREEIRRKKGAGLARGQISAKAPPVGALARYAMAAGGRA